MTVFVAVIVGFLAARLGWLALRGAFASPILGRENFRGRQVPTGAGVIVSIALLAAEAGRAIAAAAGVGEEATTSSSRAAVLIAVVGFGLLGLLDDVAGDRGRAGFRGHLGALGRGTMTTGALKLIGGAAVAVVAVSWLGPMSVRQLFVDAALVALAANLGNLLDRAPGRAMKSAGVGFLALVIATAAPTELVSVGLAVGAGLGLFLDDLHERLMLGDAGANALGAAIGVGVVLSSGEKVRQVVLAVMLALNLLSELVSFSRVIAAVPPLRALDEAGRLR